LVFKYKSKFLWANESVAGLDPEKTAGFFLGVLRSAVHLVVFG